jgi:hypothetical protein
MKGIIMKTTYNEILKHKPCEKGLKLAKPEWVKDPDMAIDFKELLEVAGVKNTFWCLRTQEYKSYCLILADIAESVLYIYKKAYPDDSRVRDSIESIRRYSRGEISLKELETACAAALAAAEAAARDACAAACAARDAACAARAATCAAARAAARAACAAAWAARAAAWDAQWKKNEEILRRYL